MDSATNGFGPKVHPLTRPIEPEDPLTLHATAAPGDPEVLLRCVVQEYAWMGWGVKQILALFREPGYPALNALLHAYGEAALGRRVAAILERMGSWRFHAVEAPAEATPEEGPELVQLGLPRSLNHRPQGPSGGSSHAEGL